jgi:predicted house-cleaning noncanonical NTP pyrophosphatase (MazG superfamily)
MDIIHNQGRMSGKYLLDTNTAIDYLINKLSPSVSIFLEEKEMQVILIAHA